MICPTCHQILTRAAEWEPIWSGEYYSQHSPHHTTTQSLQSSLDAKCLVCVAFWSKFTPEERKTIFEAASSTAGNAPEVPELLSMQISAMNNPDELDFSLQLSPRLLEKVGDFQRSTWFRAERVKDREEDGRANRPQVPIISDSTKSSETLSQAKRWFDDCLENHTECNSPSHGSWYPTRLLDSGPLDTSDGSTVQLIETQAKAPTGPYTTLSHSWGKGHSLTLNRASYPVLLEGVPLSTLPQTFQDALFVSRQIGVRYFWVDAMCIFQDEHDLSDWNRETSLMHKIYLNSICNIVAAETPDSSHSIFAVRDPGDVAFASTEAIFKSVRHQRAFHADCPPANETFVHKYVISDCTFWDQVADARINTRGWVLQERFMSPRGLHFGAQQLFWECRERDAAEVAPCGLRSSAPSMGFKMDFTDERSRVPKEDLMYDHWEDRGYAPWSSLVETYSACELSYPSDKLVAFSAIMKQIGAVFEDEYVAGISHRFFEHELLWCLNMETTVRPYGPSRPTGETSRYETYVAPSWSWASVKGKVQMGDTDITSTLLIRADKYKLEYVTEDKTGAVRGGWLQLSGSLKPVKLLRRPAVQNSYRMWDVVVNGLEITKDESTNSWGVSLDVPQENFAEENEKNLLYCMPAREYYDGPDQVLSVHMEALLFKVVDAGKGTFERIGLLRGDGDKIGKVLTSKTADEKVLPCVKYKDGRHSILVV
ncbi:hypothetical protein AK830_g5438 [Neonectria ditissima]|uniref:Heterokaryon incompatibility domain-containing protein n=1 Tax=Neonectria ditissima TaxID=78410 RepID=A0A0P7BL62_9HYPO|nr:hypothetical protein AK830_g5438 [Neonectria ditissima]